MPTILHATLHPRLDAFWIFDFEEYYNPLTTRKDVWGHFSAKRLSPVESILTAALFALKQSKEFR